MSNYWKKKLDELNKSSAKSSSSSSDKSDYWGGRMAELEEAEKKKKEANSPMGGSGWQDPLMTKILSDKNKKDEEEDDSPFGFIGDLTDSLTGFTKKAGKNAASKAKDVVKSIDFFDGGAFKDGYDFGDVTKTILGTAGDVGLSAAKGAARVAEGIGDLGTYGLAYGAQGLAKGAKKVGLDDLAWNLEGTATDLKYAAQEDRIGDLTMDADKSLDKYSLLGKTSNAILEGVGQVGVVALTGGAGSAAGLGAAGTQALTLGTMGLSSTGSGISEAYQSGATDGEAATYGLIAGASDTITEMLFGGLGKSLNMVGFGKGLSSADDILAKKVSNMFSNQIAKNFAEFGIKAGAEGLEEVLAGVAQAAGKKATYMSEEDFGEILKDENLLEQFVVGAVTSGFMQSGYIPGNYEGSLREANKNKTDFITGFTANDQTVFDKVVEDRIAEQEKDGKKLTRREKAAIEAEVKSDLKKGYITTDTIESILGGESYKAYKDTVDKENSLVEKQKALLEEYNKLGGKEADQARYTELSKQLQDLQAEIDNPQSKAQQRLLKAQLNKEVYELTKNDSLRESYFEVVRGQQKFEADLSQYKGRARDVIQKVMDSKLADNSNQTHEFWDWAANMSSSMDTDITLATNEQILDMVKTEYKENGWKFDESKFEGQVIDGYVSKNGIVLNASSKRALSFVVGHEITHKLEKTKHYGKLQKLLFEYAKGEYESRYNERKGQYSNKFEADENFKKKVDREVTGDLVGDYIFNDKGFIDHLTKDRNVFMRVWDEIKYMAKIATAGSEQAKQLEKVKREFERAYREMQKNTADISDVKFSLENANKRKYNKRSRYSDTETQFLIWENSSAPVGEVKKFVRYGKTHYYEKTENGCVELSRSQYNERAGVYVEKNYRRAEREISEAADFDASTQGGIVGHHDSNRDPGGTATVFGQTFREEFSDDTAGSVSGTLGHDSRIGINQSEYNEEASDDSDASFVTFSNDYATIRNFMKEGDTADSDIQFSLSESVEKTKDLVALHNLTADKLTKSLELGGLPMPSLAITKADIPHSNFGEITLIFGRETIDPKVNKKNKAYSADAWTPVFPRTEYEADSKVANSVSQKLRDLGGKIDDYFQRDLNRVNHGFEDYLNSEGGEEGLIQRVMDNYGMKAAYLEDSGKHIETVTTQQEAEKNFNPDSADKYQKIMEILGVTTAEEIGKVNLKDAIDNHGSELEAVYPGITKTAMRMGRLFGIVKSYIENKDAAPVYNTVVDGNATRKAVDDALDTEGYEAWVRNLFSGIVKDSGIYNNKDIFTPSGNRRSFKQTHLPVTLENIVKAMASQNDGKSKNVSGFNGIKTLRAATAETFKSVDEMHQRKGRLQNRTQEEADALNDELQTRLYKVMEAIANESGQVGGDNPFIRLDSIGEILTEIGESGKYSVADIQRVFKQYSRNVSDDTALEVKQLLYDVTQMPVNIFESKPQRVVGFDEAKVFVIPRNADVKLKQELLNRGYSIAEYDPDVEGDRQKVVNQFEEYKFSLSNVGQNFRDTGGYKYYSRSATPATELRFEAPVAEDIAPVTQEAEVTEAEMQDLFPDDLAPTQQELENLLDRKESLESEMLKMGESGDFSNFENINAEYENVQTRIADLEAEEADRFGGLDDADAPPARVVYHDELPSNDDPFADRDMGEVGNRKVKAYMYENPEVKPFFQAEANVMLGDLYNSTKGERWYNDELYYASGGEKGWGGTSRNTTDDIAELLDQWHYTYADIEEGLKAIIEDHGAENNACSKRIEFMLNDRLLKGYTAVDGRPMPANQEYKNLLKEKNITEYNKGAFDNLVAFGDDFAPMAEDFAPAAKSPVDNAPVAEIYDTKHKKGVVEGQQAMFDDPVPEKITRKVLHERILDNVKSTFSTKGFDFDKVLKKAKNLSTFATVDNIPQRVMEKALGYKEGQILSDITVNKVAQNETEGIKWLNSFTDRKNGLLANISKQYNIKPGSKKSAAAQMYAEGFYVNENNEIIQYGDRELAMDFPDAQDQKNIKGLARDPRIRKIYDDTLAMINESRTRNAYPEIPRLDNYFLHFRAMDDTFSKLGLPFNPNDIRAKDLPTDLNGVTADLKPGQPYFASAMHRTGKRTSFDLLGGLERYLTSAKNQIYHIDDIQTLRALRNYIADTYGQANGLEGLDVLSEEEAQDRIEKVYNSHLSTFAKFLNEEANILAGKTALIDRGLEGIIGRRGITTLNTINQQVGKNMVGLNISSSLTNFLPVMQAMAKTNKFDFVKGLAQTAANKVGSIFGRGDGFAENSPVIIRRKGAESFYRTPWQKAGDAGYVLMSAVDDISTELIARTKYNELTRKGMDSQKAHIETDKWVSRLMGDRSLGQMPQLYNSKMLGLLTKFQLEVRNQLDSQFYDTIQEAKVSTEDIQNGLLRNAKKAAKIGATFFELAVLQHAFGMAFESVAGYNPAFDIIEVITKMFGWDDDEEDEDTVLDNIEEGFLALLEDLPYTSTLTGGRIPISSALPIEEFIKGEDQYGNEKSRWETLGEIAPYYLLPGGYGQIKKTAQGLSMFDDDLPIAGSYTDKGNLRFPVEDTPESRIKAGVFGQWANENARDYFDNERSPLKPKQIDEFIDLDIPIAEYWEIREGMSGLTKLEEKADYIESLDLPTEKKNILINNIADRKEPIDMEDYGDYSSFEEFDFAEKNPEKYKFLERNGISYQDYANADEDTKDAYNWAYNNPEKHTLSKAITDDVVEYRKYAGELYDIRADKDSSGKSISGSAKEKKLDYINNLDLSYGQKIILFKSLYEADDTYNYEIVEYLNGRDDISYKEMETILKELGFQVDANGNVSW